MKGVTDIITRIEGWVYAVQCHFQQYFNYIMTLSFIGGGNQSIWRKPQPCHKSL